MAFTWLISSLGPIIDHHINVTTSWLIGHKYKTTSVRVFVNFSFKINYLIFLFANNQSNYFLWLLVLDKPK